MSPLKFKTELDRTPAADDGSCMPTVWHRRPGAHHAHAYPADQVDGRHHFCQGVSLSKLRDPSTNPGKFELPLYSPAQVKAFESHERHKVPVCGCCYGVLYWLFGDIASQTVHGYRLLSRTGRRAAGSAEVTS